jgi:hypothetical protein
MSSPDRGAPAATKPASSDEGAAIRHDRGAPAAAEAAASDDPALAASGSAPTPPSGLRWRLTGSFTARSREERLRLFLRLVRPGPDDRVLDLGVTDADWRSGNFLEAGYPWPERITAVALTDAPAFRARHPKVRFEVADGRALPFEDDAFDIGFSNAVIEHVGSREDQRRFVHELVRTCRRVFLATPDARFPVDPHTLLPFVHWLPRRVRHPLLRASGQGRWASEAALRPMTATELRSLFPPGVPVRIHGQRALGLRTVLIALADRGGKGLDPDA